MTMDHLKECLMLIRSPGIGPVKYFDAVRYFGSEKDALKALSQKGQVLAPIKKIEEEIKLHEKIGARILLYKDPEYPEALKQINDFPPVLSVMGQTNILNQSCAAIVGARAASINGKSFAQKLASELGHIGYVVVSGLARGIDGAAHTGALESGTIAVVAGGVDVLYPPEHHKLRSQIIEHGAVISEMPLTLFPGAKHFPRRNRLIAGMSKAVCVVEAGKPSGSMITAGYALDLGRDLFAVPGFPGDPKSAGSNQLLKNGAYVLEGVEDILNVCGRGGWCPSSSSSSESHVLKSAEKSEYELSGLEEKILTQLSPQPIPREDLAIALSAAPESLNAVLLELELSGKIYCDQAGQVSLRV